MLWMPLSPGSRKACSTSVSAPLCTVSRAWVACSTCARLSRKASRTRAIESTLTPWPTPSPTDQTAGMIPAPIEASSARCRE
jgi:hypothetical protein